MRITELNIRKQAHKYGAINILHVFNKLYLKGIIDDETFDYAYFLLRNVHHRTNSVTNHSRSTL